MRNFIKIIIALVVVTIMVSCGNKRTRQVQYMPDMYVSVPYDVNGADGVNGKMVNQTPVVGTIARGQVPFEYASTYTGYKKAKDSLKSPLKVNQLNLDNGKKMYDIYCAICHGKKGDGDGILSQRDKFNGIPNYADRDITEGSIYHVIMYGKGIMGSHASQLNNTERWQVVQYVEKLKKDLK